MYFRIKTSEITNEQNFSILKTAFWNVYLNLLLLEKALFTAF